MSFFPLCITSVKDIGFFIFKICPQEYSSLDHSRFIFNGGWVEDKLKKQSMRRFSTFSSEFKTEILDLAISPVTLVTFVSRCAKI